MSKKRIIIVSVILFIIVTVVIASLINISMYNDLLDNPINIIERNGIRTKDTFKIEKISDELNHKTLAYTTLESKRKYYYGGYVLGYKAHCIFNDSENIVEYELYEVNWARVYAKIDGDYYIHEAITLFETKHIVVMNKDDEKYFNIIWSDLGF